MKYRTVPSSLKTWEGETVVDSDAARKRPSPSAPCTGDYGALGTPWGHAQSQDILRAESAGAAAGSGELPEPIVLMVLDCTSGVGLMKDIPPR